MTIGGLKSIVYLGLMKQQETMESRMLLCALLAEGLGWELDFQEKDNVWQVMFGTLNPFPEKITETLSGSMLCQYFFNDRSCRTGSVGRHAGFSDAESCGWGACRV